MRMLFELFDGVREGRLSLFPALRYLLLKGLGFPDLLLNWPRACCRLVRVFGRRYPFRVYAFSSFDLWLRTYYNKLVRNFRQVGRFGYVWDEGLGFPMGPRFGSNLGTYAVYGALSAQGFGLVSLSLFILFMVLTGVSAARFGLTLAISLLLFASPNIVFSLAAYRVKPEVIWWSLAIPALFSALNHHWTEVWGVLGVLLLMNTSVSVLLGILLAPLWTWSVSQGAYVFGPDLLLLAPGLVVRSWRFASAFLDGNLGATLREQRATQKNEAGKERGRLKPDEAVRRSGSVIITALFLTALLALASWRDPSRVLALTAPLLIFHVVNSFWFKLADSVTNQLALVCMLVAATLHSGAWLGLLGVYLVAYQYPAQSAWRIMDRRPEDTTRAIDAVSRQADLEEAIAFMREVYREYPWFEPMPFPKPDAIVEFLAQIPDGARILMEGDGDPRSGTRFGRFHNWTYEILAPRQIEFVNHTFIIRMVEPEFSDRYLDRFGAPHLSGARMREICDRIGVSYVIAFSPGTVRALRESGYRVVRTIHYREFIDLARLLLMPEADLVLMANPDEPGLLVPPANLVRKGNTVSWPATQGTSYLLRYRYFPGFKAHQNGRRLPVHPTAVFPDLPLKFMTLRAEADGEVMVTFNPMEGIGFRYWNLPTPIKSPKRWSI